MHSNFGMALVVPALVALVSCGSSSSGSPAPAEAGAGCGASLASILNATPTVCPVDGNMNPVSYDEAITSTCASLSLKTGDVEYGQCFEYLVFQVDKDATGTNSTKCFYDVNSHALVGVLQGTQCGGDVDPSCTISGLHSGGGGYQSCAPVVDAGGGG
jgi:hypothetical protein